VDDDRCFDREGKPISYRRWAELMRDLHYSVVAQDSNNSITVSTVWLGLDHSFGNSAPLIFETMIFAVNEAGDRESRAQFRYATEAEAKAGHARLVKQHLDIVSRIGFLASMTPEEIKKADNLYDDESDEELHE